MPPNTRRSLPKQPYAYVDRAESCITRLSEADVKKIFSCVKEGVLAKDIAFKIIKIEDTRLMLTPPSFEFGDGIYVLLRNMNARDSHDFVPSSLKHLVISDDNLLSMASCRWSLSGPSQASSKKKEGSLQQRYSYPRGRPEYSITKGGSMWTMIDKAGNDNLEVRVFHVYQTVKRFSISSSSSSTSASGEGNDWSSTKSSKKKKLPPKKRIKMEEDERVVGDNSMKQRPKTTITVDEDDVIDALLSGELMEVGGCPQPEAISGVFGEDSDNGYSFIPIENADSASSDYYQYQSTKNPPFFGTVSPPLPYLPASQNNAIPTGRPLGLLSFSNKLYQLQDAIFNDISATSSIDEQAHKVAVMQHWLRDTAQRPLQPITLAPVDNISPPPPTAAATGQGNKLPHSEV